MNEAEFKAKWESEKPIYRAWGEYIVDTISNKLEERGKNLNTFLKTPTAPRLKDDSSIIDKAFYRQKEYADPYNEIEDKVGARFIVLLLSDLKEVCEVVEAQEDWDRDPCKHFEEDRKNEPLLFTYQSVHYIVKPKNEMVVKGVTIPADTPCEIQIRTLLQHAHAELTHDAIYKAKRAVQPQIHRTVAKSMALIETTDDFFMDVMDRLNQGPLQEFNVIERLDSLYYSYTGLTSHNQKSAISIWDAFEQFIDERLVDDIQNVMNQNEFLAKIIQEKYSQNAFYQQSTILFVYWMLKKKPQRLISDWPISPEGLSLLATDLGVSIHDE